MAGNAGYDAGEYAQSKSHPFRLDVEAYTLFKLAGNVQGQRVLDAGCGDGVYSRRLIELGASHVLGIDADQNFIALARQKSQGIKEIDYIESFIQDSQGQGDRDLALGSYILSYPESLDEAASYCRAIASHLKPGGRFVGFNNNPFDSTIGVRDLSKYGLRKTVEGNTDGSRVIYHVDGVNDPIINYFLSPGSYEEAFAEAGFHDFAWKEATLSPEDKRSPEKSLFWREFFDPKCPFIAMTVVKD